MWHFGSKFSMLNDQMDLAEFISVEISDPMRPVYDFYSFLLGTISFPFDFASVFDGKRNSSQQNWIKVMEWVAAGRRFQREWTLWGSFDLLALKTWTRYATFKSCVKVNSADELSNLKKWQKWQNGSLRVADFNGNELSEVNLII